MSKTLHDCIGESAAFLEEKGVDSPLLSAEVLAAHALELDRVGLITERRKILSEKESEVIHDLVLRRGNGEPVAYIVGEREFYGLRFSVGPGVLVPRPETEHIVEQVEKLYDKSLALQFADLGTGSGILAVTIAVLFPKAYGIALDLSEAALSYASANAGAHGVSDRVQCSQGTMFEPFAEPDSLDLVVSNPPYVTELEYDELDDEVRSFEPCSALVSGEDGLDHLRRLLPHAANSLRSGGHLLVEIGWKQGCAAEKIIREYACNFKSVMILKDFAGYDRVLFATLGDCKKTTLGN